MSLHFNIFYFEVQTFTKILCRKILVYSQDAGINDDE